MKKKIKELMCNKNIWFFAMVTLLFFGVLFRMEFAVDSYATLTFSTEELIYQFAPLGRFMIILAGSLINLFQLKAETTYFLSYLLAVICMIVSLYKLYDLIQDEIKNELAKKIIPILIVLNAIISIITNSTIKNHI